MTSDGVLQLAHRFGDLFRRVAGSDSSLRDEASRRQRHWYQAPGRHLLSVAIVT
jgi:hypothetical protein